MMPQFLLLCRDKPESLERRMATREAHLNYVAGRIDEVLLAGPLLDDAGDLCGSLFILEAADRDAVAQFNKDDPYTKASLFDRVEISPFRPLVGQFMPK